MGGVIIGCTFFKGRNYNRKSTIISEDEQCIGKWFDEGKIYQKTFEIDYDVGSGVVKAVTLSFIINQNNVKNIFGLYIVNDEIFSLNSYYDGNNNNVIHFKQNELSLKATPGGGHFIITL